MEAGASSGSPGQGGTATAAALRDGTSNAEGVLGIGPPRPGRLLSERKLRQLVLRLRGCLSSLSSQQTHVLVLRTGLGLKHDYTRRQVARILSASLAREGRIERQAVASLTMASAQGRCGSPATSAQTAMFRAVSLLSALNDGAPASTMRTSVTTSSGAGASQVRSGSRHRSGPQPARSQRPPTSSAAIAPPGHGAGEWLLLVLLIAAALALGWFTLSRLRSQPEGAALAAPRRSARRAEARAGLAAMVGAVAGRRHTRRAATPERRPGHGPDHAAGVPPPPRLDPAPDDNSGADGVEAFELGAVLAEEGDAARAEAAFRRADAEGHGSAASNLGVLLEQRGDPAGAEAAYRRADQRGDATGAFNLGAMLADRGDLVGAESAFRRADQRGDPAASFNVGKLMEERNDLFGAEAAFRRADERDHPSGAARLGMLLEHRGDLSGAEAAYRRADRRGDAVGAFELGALLEKRQDLLGAEAAYARAAERGGDHVADLARAALSLLRTRR